MLVGKKFIWTIVLIVSICIFSTCSMDNVSGENLLGSNDRLLRQIEITSNWAVFRPEYASRSLAKIITYQANGLIEDYLDHVIVNDSILAVGSISSGFSYIALNDIPSPKGKVSSYIGPDSNISVAKFGFSGFAVNPENKKLYAWYGSDIVDVVALNPIYSDAPDFTRGVFGASPLNRFVIDDGGTFWIGASNLDYDGSRYKNYDNGLYAITIEGQGTKNLVLDQAIWHLFKDSNDIIWASTQDGLYKFTDASTFEKVNLPESKVGWFVEQTFEYNDKIHIILKNFFHNSNIDTKYELYEWDSENKEFKHVVDLTDKEKEKSFKTARAFVLQEKLYFAVHGTLREINTEGEVQKVNLKGIEGSNFGQHSQCVSDGTLYSVGNFPGIHILKNTEPIILTQATTAEQLISNNIFTMYVPDDNSTVYIGPYGGGGISYLKDDRFTTLDFPYNGSISSFFTHDDNIYVQGSLSLGMLNNSTIETKKVFFTNSERSTYDPSGYIWAYPNFGDGTDGVIAMMDLNSYQIHRTKQPNNTDYYKNNGNSSSDTSLFWELDQSYHFNHVQPIPTSTEMMIAVSGETEGFATNPHTLIYSHSNNLFTKAFLPSSASKGIMFMASEGSMLYGVGNNQLYKFENRIWVELYPLKLRGDFRSMIIIDSYAFIGSGWGAGTPGFEIVNLETGFSKYFNTSNTPLPTDAVLSLAAQRTSSNSMRIWFGTNVGLAYCDVSL